MFYSAATLYECLVNNESDIFELRAYLVQADNQEMATEKALAIAKKNENSYKNEFGQTVDWKFKDLLSVEDMTSVEDGTEIFSMFLSRQEAASIGQPFPENDPML